MKKPVPFQVLSRRSAYRFEAGEPFEVLSAEGRAVLAFEGRGEASLCLPAGGPYRLRYRSGEETFPVYSGDLWVLAGQSNMVGEGLLEDATVGISRDSGRPESASPGTAGPGSGGPDAAGPGSAEKSAGGSSPSGPSPASDESGVPDGISNFTMDDLWVPARHPLHELEFSIDKAHWTPTRPRVQKIWTRGAGLGIPFALEMHRTLQVPIGLIPCAHGGTSLTRWNPELKGAGGDSLYGSMMRRIAAAGGGEALSGLLWYQGESDRDPADEVLYEWRFKYLVQSVRLDTLRPDLPFFYTQLARHALSEALPPAVLAAAASPGSAALPSSFGPAGASAPGSASTVPPGVLTAPDVFHWNRLQATQVRLVRALPGLAMTSAVDLPLMDVVHVDTAGLERLGRRFAHLALGRSQGLFLGAVEPVFAPGTVRVSFTGVTGRLRQHGIADGEPVIGFTLRNERQENAGGIFRVFLDPRYPDSVFIRIHGEYFGKRLWYGHGLTPEVRLVDDLDMPVPFFGDLTLLPRRISNWTPPAVRDSFFFREYRVSGPFGDGEGDFDKAFPQEADLAPRECDWDIAQATRSTWAENEGLLWISNREKDGRTGVYFLWSRLQSGRRRRARLWMGFGGRSQVFWNGKEVCRFETASRSMDRNQAAVEVDVEEGENILFIKATPFTGLGNRWIGTVRVEGLEVLDFGNRV